MRTIRHGIERVLTEVLQAQDGVSTIYGRVVIVPLSVVGEQNAAAYQRSLTLIREHFEDADGLLLAYPDNDLVIISRLLTQKTFEAFCAGLQPALPAPLAAADICRIFELPRDKVVLARFMKAKIDSARQQEAAQAQKNEAAQQKNTGFVDKPIAAQWIETIAERRKNRVETVVQLIEDDAFSQRVIAGLLKDKCGFVSSLTGQQGIEHYVSHAPDIVFLDIGLPDINGQKLLEKILAIDPAANIVMLSGNGSAENVVRAVKTGAKSFIGKPFTRQKLMTSIIASAHVQLKQKHHGDLNAKFI